MLTVSHILSEKGETVYNVPRTWTVLAATQKMNDYSIGAVVVTEGDRMVGIFTERDVLRRVVAAERNPARVLVGDVMTTQVACCGPDTSLEDARTIMKHHRIRHLPILGGEGTVHGLISIGDLNAQQASNQETTIFYLSEYLYGRV